MNWESLLGPVPSGWRLAPLWSMFARKKLLGHVDEPMVSVFRDHGVVYKESLDNLNKTAEDRSIYQLVEPGWLVVNRMKAWQGSVGISFIRGIVSGHYICFEPIHRDANPRYLNHLLRSPRYAAVLSAMSRGVRPGQIEIDNDYLYSLPILLPPLDTQRRIADFLDDQTTRIDKIVAARERQMSLLRDEGLEHARQLTTIGLTGGTTMTGIEWMPIIGEGWALRRVASLFWTGSGTTPTSDRPEYFGGGIPWVVTGDIRDADVVSTENSVTELALRDFTPLRLYPPGSLVVAMYGATRGRVGILRIRACVNQACCVLRPLGEMTSELAAAWFRAHNEQIVELAMGSGQPNLNQEIIRALRVPVPSRAEQTVILAALAQEAERTKRAEALRDSSVALLQEFKRSLISAAVSGEFDVSTASGRGVPA